MRLFSKSLITAALSSALIACGGSSSSSSTTNFQQDIDTTTAVNEIVDLIVIPAVDNFQQQAQQLAAASDTFCTTINEANLAAAQNQWKETAEAWFEYLPYNLGPTTQSPDAIEPQFIFIDSLRLRGTNYTATVRNDLANMIASASPIDPASIGTKTFSLVGLLAAEVALFERSSDKSQTATDIVADYSANANKCLALEGYTGQIAQRATTIQQSWKTDYKNSGTSFRDLLLNGGLDQFSGDSSESADAQLILSTNEFMDYVHKRTILNDAGVLADHSWQLVNAGLLSFEKMIEGTTATSESFAELMAINAASDLATIRANITTAKQNIVDQDVDTLYSTLKSIDGNIKRELTNGLDITVGINFSDGD